MKTVRLIAVAVAAFAMAMFVYQFAQEAKEAPHDEASLVALPNAKVDPTKPAGEVDASTIKVTREAECRWASTPPVLDGDLGDPCWQKAQPIEHFAAYWDKQQRMGTVAYLLWDNDAIYYGGVMMDSELKAFGDNRNDHLWNGDVFELFLKPSPDKPEYFEFQTNPKATVFEVAFAGRDKIPPDFSKEPLLGNKSVIKLKGTLDKPGDTDTSWIVEGRIPWSAFTLAGGKPKPEATWSFAFCRYDYGPEGTKPLLMSSAPLSKGNFHRYEDYGKLTFVGPAK